jgi:hypothetical protein
MRVTNLILGVALLGFGMLYLFSLSKVPPQQKILMTIVATLNLLGGVTVLTLILFGIMK